MRVVLGLALSILAPTTFAMTSAVNLRCEYLAKPLAVVLPHPRLSWELKSDGQSIRQKSYRIIVASSPAILANAQGDLWDSGQVKSDETLEIPYQGRALASGQRVFWKVKVWDSTGTESGWSKSAEWGTGILKDSDWKADWLGRTTERRMELLKGASWLWVGHPGPDGTPGKNFFRKIFTVQGGPGTLRISADDSYRFRLNDGEWVPGPNHADAWKVYQVHNVDLKSGENVLEIESTNQVKGYCGMIARLDSGTHSFVTSEDWEGSQDGTKWGKVTVLGPWGCAPWNKIEGPDRNAMDPVPKFRGTWTLREKPVRATLFVAALGATDVSLNGKSLDRDVLSPGWTDYWKRSYYRAFDATANLKAGKNSIEAMLGDGWYASFVAFTGKRHLYGGEPMVRLQLRAEFADGTTQVHGTDETWEVASGPFLSADLLMGCNMDLTANWGPWTKAGVVDYPLIQLQPHPGEPVRSLQILKGKLVSSKNGKFIYDFGQNLVGYCRIKIESAVVAKLVVRHAEFLDAKGELYVENLRAATATDSFVVKKGVVTVEPKFTFHGFRYAEVTGITVAPKQVEGIVVHSDLEKTYQFDSSNALLNKLVQNIDWGLRGNFLDVPTDCPQRDERAGWTGDAQVFAKTAMFLRDTPGFYTKWLVDLMDSQNPDGAFADVAPNFIGHGNAAWEDAGVIVTYRMFEMYGDRSIIRKNWPFLTKFMQCLAKYAKDFIRGPGSYGDWLLLDGPQRSDIHGTAYYIRCADLMSIMAGAIGETNEEQKYQMLSLDIRNAFVKKFVSPEGAVRDSQGESQTFYALAIAWGIVPDKLKAVAGQRLIENIENQKGHLTTGFIGTPVLLRALDELGRSDLAADLVLHETYPSWLYQVKLGSTTMWERWDGWTPEKGFQDPGMNSFNHYWLGCVGEWIFTRLAGVDTNGAGWKTLYLNPYFTKKLTHIDFAYDSIRGRVESHWKWNGSLVDWTVTIPANTTAVIAVPAFLNGKKVEELGSGTYHLTVHP